jgi:hypothetical protein
MVIAAIGDDALGALARSPDLRADGGDAVDQRQ